MYIIIGIFFILICEEKKLNISFFYKVGLYLLGVYDLVW